MSSGWLVRAERLLLASVLLSASASLLRAQSAADVREQRCVGAKLETSTPAGGFRFNTYQTAKGNACLKILRDGRVLFLRHEDDGGSFYVGQRSVPGDGVPGLRSASDLTGRGHPDMIVNAYDGGVHCCVVTYVFELEPVFRLVATLHAGEFVRLGREKRWFYRAIDQTFQYWPGAYCDSPAEGVTLQFVDDAHGGSYHLAFQKMRKPRPSARAWSDYLATAHVEQRDSKGWETGNGQVLWQPVLDLIYGGHGDLARKFLDRAWPVWLAGKDHWVGEFCSVLKNSPYWPDLAGSLSAMPRSCSRERASRPG